MADPHDGVAGRRSRKRWRVEGIVQGEGDAEAIQRFISALEQEAPALAVVERVEATPTETLGESGSRIVQNQGDTDRRALISPGCAEAPHVTQCDQCRDAIGAFDDESERRRSETLAVAQLLIVHQLWERAEVTKIGHSCAANLLWGLRNRGGPVPSGRAATP